MKNPILSPNYDVHLLRGGTVKDASDASSISWREREDPAECGDPWFDYIVYGFRVFRSLK